MTWKDVGQAVGKAAPLLGSLLGPQGGAIGALIASALGVDNDAKEVAEALKRDPDALIKLKQLELAHKEELEKLNLERMRLELQEQEAYLKDTQDARAREASIVASTGKADYNLYALGWTITIGFIGLIVLLNFHMLPPDTTGVIFMLFGALSTAFGQVMQYFFGSSVGSKEKTGLLAQHERNKYGRTDTENRAGDSGNFR